jgi:hypothetical protein
MIVELSPSLPTLFLLGLMRQLADHDFIRLMVFGGALRDPYMGHPEKINDIDIAANWSFVADRLTLSETAFEERIVQRLARVPAVEALHFRYTDNDGPWNRSQVDFLYKGQRVSLFENTSDAPFDERLLMIGDAPLNTVGLNICGGVRAHHLFLDHARRKIYAPYPTDDSWQSMAINRRYAYLRRKYPGLTYIAV